jgi:transporter family protein
LLDGRRCSILAFENGALDIAHEANIRSSIGGRLGGSIRTSMAGLGMEGLDFDDDDDEVGEGTGLLKGGLIEPPPALMAWIFPALACAAAYAFYNIFIKKGSFTIHPILGGVVLQFVAALLGTCLLGAIMIKDKDTKADLEYDKAGLFWSCAAGLAVGTAEMLSFCVSGMGVPATQSIPIIIGGSVLFGAVLGILTLGEKLMCHVSRPYREWNEWKQPITLTHLFLSL